MKKLGEMNKLVEEIWWRNMWTRGLFVLIPLGIGIGLYELSGTATSFAGLCLIGLGIGFFWSGIGKSIREGRKRGRAGDEAKKEVMGSKRKYGGAWVRQGEAYRIAG